MQPLGRACYASSAGNKNAGGTRFIYACGGATMSTSMEIRILPWLVALAGLAIPLVASGFAIWVAIVAWLAALSLTFILTRRLTTTTPLRIGAAILLLPLLFVLGWEGGWWLIPADLTWLAIELGQGIRERTTAHPSA